MSEEAAIKTENSVDVSALSFREANANKDFTLIARDCIGGILYHQLGLRFLSPTINLFLTPKDFNAFCLNLKAYIDGELVEEKDESVPYPVGLLYPSKDSKAKQPVRLDFMHYETFAEAALKWNERKARIRWDNLFVISSFCYSTEVPTLTEELVSKWNEIPYKKMIFVTKKHGFDGEFVIQEPENCAEFAWLLSSPDAEHPWKRAFNEYDFIRFLNEGE